MDLPDKRGSEKNCGSLLFLLHIRRRHRPCIKTSFRLCRVCAIFCKLFFRGRESANIFCTVLLLLLPIIIRRKSLADSFFLLLLLLLLLLLTIFRLSFILFTHSDKCVPCLVVVNSKTSKCLVVCLSDIQFA